MARHRLDEGDDEKKWGGPDLTLEEWNESDEQRHSRKKRRKEPQDDQRPRTDEHTR